jgi:hypothetical protein
MDLNEENEGQPLSDFNYDEEISLSSHKKDVRRMLEERLERKRLKEEFKDDFDELSADFNWDLIDK